MKSPLILMKIACRSGLYPRKDLHSYICRAPKGAFTHELFQYKGSPKKSVVEAFISNNIVLDEYDKSPVAKDETKMNQEKGLNFS